MPAVGLDSCCNTARQANFSPSRFLLQSRFWIRWVNNRLKNKALSHIYALGITRNKNTLHFFWWQTKVSNCSQPRLHGILDELKVLKREEQILKVSDSISFGFLSLFLSFFLRLPISNLSALPAMDWLCYTIEVLLQSALQPHLICLGDHSRRLQKIEVRDLFEMCMRKEKCIIFHWIQVNRLTK